MSYSATFDVRVHLDIPGRSDAHFDITDVKGESEQEAVGYALALSTECFGLPRRHIHARVISSTPIIDL